LDDPHDPYFITNLDEEYQVTPMPCVSQSLMQIIALLEAAGALAHFHNFSFDLCHERGCTGSVVERNEVANVYEVCPCGGQDNQLCHDQDLSA
jgi:hypothetical protein